MFRLNDNTNFNVFINNIQRQFLSCYPLHCISWQDFPNNLDWDQQKALIDATFNSPLNAQFPIKLSYQLTFLRKLIYILESNCSEVHDVVYETYCEMQLQVDNDCANKYAFKHYILDPGVQLTLRESMSFVAEGTTGLCSWQASLALANYLMENPTVIKDKCILELGAGTGLCGLILLKMCQSRHILLTDGSALCVQLMCENIRRNFPDALECENGFKINSQIVECLVVPWECIEEEHKLSIIKPEVIIAADVVYDDSCFKDLSSAIHYIFNLRKNEVQMFLAATVRNEVTLYGFLNIMESLGFQISECDAVPLERSKLYWDRKTPVKILKLTR